MKVLVSLHYASAHTLNHVTFSDFSRMPPKQFLASRNNAMASKLCGFCHINLKCDKSHIASHIGSYSIALATLENVILTVKICVPNGMQPELKLLPVSTTPSWFLSTPKGWLSKHSAPRNWHAVRPSVCLSGANRLPKYKYSMAELGIL